MSMKVNLRGLFTNIASDTGQRRAYTKHCLDEVYDHIQGLIDGKHTPQEFAEHYSMRLPDDGAKCQTFEPKKAGP